MCYLLYIVYIFNLETSQWLTLELSHDFVIIRQKTFFVLFFLEMRTNLLMTLLK